MINTKMRYLLALVSTIMLSSCSSLTIKKMPSVGQDHRIKSLVMHFTAINYKRSMFALKESGAVSSHYLIPTSNDDSYPHGKLEIVQLVDESSRAWHAGVSYWQGRRNLNDTSIGIEIVNVPECASNVPVTAFTRGGEYGAHRLCTFPDYDPKQVELIIKLAKDILQRHPGISPTQVIGHSDIAPSRKNDPGPRFPWYELYKNGVGAWYDNDTLESYWRMFETYAPSTALLQSALKYYGYDVPITGELNAQTQDVLYAFQSHFLPWEVDGSANTKTAAAIFALLEKYHEGTAKVLLKKYFNEAEFSYGNRLADDTELSSRYWSLTNLDKNKKLTLTNSSSTPVESMRLEINNKSMALPSPKLAPYASMQLNVGRYVNGVNDSLLLVAKGKLKQINIQAPTKRLEVKNKSPKYNKRLNYTSVFKAKNNTLYTKKSSSTAIQLSSASSVYSLHLALLKLASEGKVDFDKPVTHYLYEYRGDGRNNRTIKNLLRHESGYPANFIRDEQTQAEGQQARLTPQQVLLQHVPFEYGLKFTRRYSKYNNFVLALLVERVTGQAFDQYVNEHIYQPLKLTNTQLLWDLNNEQLSVNSTYYEVGVLSQLILNQGSYKDSQIFASSKALNWWQQQTQLSVSNYKAEINPECLTSHYPQVQLIGMDDSAWMMLDKNHNMFAFAKPEAELSSLANGCPLTYEQQSWMQSLYLD